VDQEIYWRIKQEQEKQRSVINLIASENYVSKAVLQAVGSVMTNKYAEGYPGNRCYGGCQFVDMIEEIAIERARKLFKVEHANVQPHAGSQANMAVYFATLQPGDRILAMNLRAGGHLTHGREANFSGKLYRCFFYNVSRETEKIDYEEVARIARKESPKLIICGASSYPRIIDFAAFARIAQEVGALLMADIAHISGLVATGLHPSPGPWCDFITSTTHKTLRGPRGGMILCRKQYAQAIDSAIFPGLQGGPLLHVIAGKAVAFKEAMSTAFSVYQRQVLNNAFILSKELEKRGYRLVSGGTDNHLFLLDLRKVGLTGLEAEKALERVGIIVNHNPIPYDPLPPSITSGIRLGTAAVTTRGMGENDMVQIAEWIDAALKKREKCQIQQQLSRQIRRFAREFPVQPAD
ncbi:MAG: serine hydroxymethyltransferase, partial [Candidatus Omnitrophica bacterium]|nr:serine hydroxymethyltransferase [Candidatus Omnitrophota bacterium]